MKVLIVGSGGREHAIAYSVAKSDKVDKIYCTPGNAGIAEFAECAPIGAMEFDKIVAFAKEKEIDLVIVGMDDPLVGGLVDELEAAGIRTFGPRKNAAILEGSKAFSKDLMKKYNIPTAAYENFTDPAKAIEYLKTEAKFPIVLKADGLALGKGVLICKDLQEAEDGVKAIMEDKKFGTAGNTMVIEEFMTGREVSVLSFVDGNTIQIMSSAQDHKRAFDGDRGPNTGGMGAFSPSRFYTDDIAAECMETIFKPTVAAMEKEGRPFKGVRVSVCNEEIFIDTPYHVEKISLPFSLKDRGHLDAEGRLHFLGRTDDIVSVNGRKVAAVKVCTALTELEGIEESAVICRHVDDADVLFAFVGAAREYGKQELVKLLRQTLEDYELPKQFVFMEQLPHNESGKVDKLALKNFL